MNEFEKHIPFFFRRWNIDIALKKNGELRQSLQLFDLIEKNSIINRATNHGVVFYLRVDSSQFGKADPCVLSAYKTKDGQPVIEFYENT